MPTTQTKTEDLFQKVQGLLREDESMRSDFIIRADRNKQQYLGFYDYEGAPNRLQGHSNFVIPKTQKSVISLTAVQVEQRPRIDLKPRENAIDSDLFMTRKGLMTIERAIEDRVIFAERPDPELGFGDGEEDAGVTVEEQGFDFSRLESEPSRDAFEVSSAFVERVAPMLQPLEGGGQALLFPEDFVEINDSIVAKILQNNLNILWEEGDNDDWLRDSLLNNNIFGWQPSLYSWDIELMRDVVKELHITNVWIDSNNKNVEQAEHLIVRQLVSIDEAMEQYPDAANGIASATKDWTSGLMDDSFSVETDVRSRHNIRFERPMIYIWTVWLRNARFDMSPDDAIAFGKVVFSEDGKEMFLADEAGVSIDEKTSPESKNWPKRRSVRQIQFVADEVVSDQELPHWDIPIMWMKNIPDPYKPYGIGEPDALEWIDVLINKLSSILFDHFKYYRSWSEIYPTDVWESIAASEFLDKRHAHPGRTFAIEADLYKKYEPTLSRGHGFMIAPPPMPESAFQLLNWAMNTHDEISGSTEALQGRQPSAGTSGKALDILQSAAKGMVGFKSIQTENAVRRLTRLRVHAMTKWLPLHMWKKWNDQYPTEILDAVRLRAKNMEWEVSVEVISGGGQVREQKKNEVRQDIAAGVPLDPETILDLLGYNASTVLERLAAVASQQSQGTQVNA